MSKHKSEDYKISAVNYYLDNDVSMELKLEIEKSIKKVKKINYENYFQYAYNKSKKYKNKTRKVNKKMYKDVI